MDIRNHLDQNRLVFKGKPVFRHFLSPMLSVPRLPPAKSPYLMRALYGNRILGESSGVQGKTSNLLWALEPETP